MEHNFSSKWIEQEGKNDFYLLVWRMRIGALLLAYFIITCFATVQCNWTLFSSFFSDLVNSYRLNSEKRASQILMGKMQYVLCFIWLKVTLAFLKTRLKMLSVLCCRSRFFEKIYISLTHHAHAVHVSLQMNPKDVCMIWLVQSCA